MDMAKRQKRIIAAVIVVLLLVLGIFKYASLVLPIGLSFYVFQSMGYCIDVYRGTAETETNFFRHALYVSFFPQLLQGPIGDYNRLSPQIFQEHEFSYRNAVYGLQRAAWGFFKKLVIANQISLVIDGIWADYGSYTGFLFWWCILVLYAFQLYADFSGYMDIANGCAQMLGIVMDENFETPYFSKSIAEFWRRWHITLGTWFRNYVFYPILRSDICSGIRKKYRKRNAYLANTLPDAFALLVVWFLIGLWHGAGWCYVAYGLFHGTFVILSVVLSPIYTAFHRKFSKLVESRGFCILQVVRTFLIVAFGYAIFRPADLTVTAEIIRRMTNGIGLHEMLNFGKENIKIFFEIFIGMAALLYADVYHLGHREITLRETISEYPAWKRWGLYIGFLLCIIFLGAYGKSGLDQFAYFRF